jgi:hypothetical protein
MLDLQEWIEKQWPSKMFFDPRVHERTIFIAQACMRFPTGSIPQRFESFGAIKGCYRFLNRKDMNHQKLQTGHYDNVRKEATESQGKVLFIQDGSELLYNSHKWTTGLGPTSDSFGNGMLFHSCLAVKFEEDQPKVIGLSAQESWVREEEDEKTDKKKDVEASEAKVWQKMLERTGPVPEGCNWITVGDRASDIFSFIEFTKKLGYGCVLRTKHNRKIIVNGLEHDLKEYMRSLPAMAEKQYTARATQNTTSHEQVLKISWTTAKMVSPKTEKEKKSIQGSYVRVWCETDPDIEWILFTLSSVTAKEEALEIVTIYEHRWIIEEYHKCLKTGCKIEEAQLRTADRLLNLFGILGVIATQLLQIRDISRIKPEAPAELHIDPLNVEVIKRRYKLRGEITVKEFWRRVAMLGGFLARKSDGNPGWQKIWQGWIRLQDMREGIEMFLQKNNQNYLIDSCG